MASPAHHKTGWRAQSGGHQLCDLHCSQLVAAEVGHHRCVVKPQRTQTTVDTRLQGLRDGTEEVNAALVITQAAETGGRGARPAAAVVLRGILHIGLLDDCMQDG